ncbi:acyltransferase family protein [Veillonella seminalis]|uniref:acyltransferase family protein n=1 Tax=Veillonella seminalis TaxID=1502943 RepID=UPI00402AC9B2
MVRTFIPFLLWSLIRIIELSLEGKINLLKINEILSLIINTKIPGLEIYWFFIPLFYIYLSMPVLSVIVKHASRKLLWYMLSLSFLTYSCLPLLFRFFGIKFNSALYFPLSGGGLILYVLLGYILYNMEISK